MGKITFLPPQSGAIEAINRYFKVGGQSCIFQLPTGLGKSYTALHIGGEMIGLGGDELPIGRVLYLAHKRELVQQPYDSLHVLYPDLRKVKKNGMRPAGIVQGKRNQINSFFTFATMQSMAREGCKRLRQWLDASDIPVVLVIIDEAHHAAAKSYANDIIPAIRNSFPEVKELHNDNELADEPKILGMTATVGRADGKALDSVFDDLVYQYSIIDAIQDGYSRPIRAKTVKTSLDLRNVGHNKAGTDLHQGRLVNALKVANWLETVFNAWIEETRGKENTIAFMPNVDMAHEFAAYVIERGYPAACVTDKKVTMPDGKGEVEVVSGAGKKYDKARERALTDHRKDAIRLMAGFDILLEGYDNPRTTCVLWARFTESSLLLTQAIGRAMRRPDGVAQLLKDGDDHTIVVDYDDNHFRYLNTGLPFPLHCTVLDFAALGVPLQVAGSLAGMQEIENKDINDAEENKEVPIFDAEPVENDFDLMMEDGKALQFFERNMFSMSKNAWVIYPDGTQSAYLGHADGKAHGIFIYPRNRLLMQRMSKVIRLCHECVGRGVMDDDAIWDAIDEYDTVRRLFSSFLVFTVHNAPVQSKVDARGHGREFVQWNRTGVKAKFQTACRDYRHAWEVSLPLSQRFGNPGVYSQRKLPGQNNRASTKQVNFIRTGLPARMVKKANAKLGDEVDGFGIIIPTQTSLTGIKSGRASRVISHLFIYSIVMRQLLAPRIVTIAQAEAFWTEKVKGVV